MRTVGAFWVTLAAGLLALGGCEGDLPEGKRPPRPFAQKEAVEERRAQLEQILAALATQRGEALRRSLSELSSWSAVHLGRAWDRLGPAIGRAVEQGRLQLDEDSIDLLARVGPRALELVGRGLAAPDGPTRRRAAERLIQAGESGIRLAIARLKQVPDGDPVPAQIVLGALRGQSKSSPPTVRAAAADLLWLLADVETSSAAGPAGPGPSAQPESVRLLAGLLDDPDPEVRIAAIERLASLGPRAAFSVEAVARLADDPVPGVAQVALFEIHRFGSQALEPLAALTQNPSPDKRAAALDALGRLGGEREAAAGAALPRVIALLAAGAGDAQASVRRHAYRALADLPSDPQADRILAQGLRDEDAGNRSLVAERIGRREPRAVLVEALAGASAGSEEALALEALDSLAKLGHAARDAFGSLSAAAAGGTEKVRLRVARTAYAVQPDLDELLPLLTKLLADPAVSVREETLVVVGYYGAEMIRSGQAPKKLEELFDRIRHMSLEDPATSVRRTAVNALAHIQKSFQAVPKKAPARDPTELSYPKGG